MAAIRLAGKALERKIRTLERNASEQEVEHERALAMYEDEPTRAHQDYVVETKRDLKLTKKWLARFRGQRGGGH